MMRITHCSDPPSRFSPPLWPCSMLWAPPSMAQAPQFGVVDFQKLRR